MTETAGAKLARDTNAYYHQYIAAADTKAASILAVVLPVIGLLLGFQSSGAARYVAWAGSAVVAGGALCALLTLYPRPGSKGEGFIYWEHVKGYASSATYQDAICALDATSVLRAYCEQNFVLAGLLHEKYTWLRRSIVVVVGGLVLAGISLALR